MNKTQNTLVSTPAYPPGVLAYQYSNSTSSRVAFDIGGRGGHIDWLIRLIPTVEVDTFPQGTSIPDSDLELKYALVVEKLITSDGFVIRSGALDEEAFGLTEREAYLDFLTSIRDRFFSLRRRESALSAHDSSVLDKLRSLLSQKQG